MKTMIMMNAKNLHDCLKFRQSMCALFATLTFSYAGVIHSEDSKTEKAKTYKVERKPAAVDEEVLTVPLSSDESFFTNDNMFAEDDAGVMKDMKASLHGWETTEEYARVWNLQDTGLYNTPTTSQKAKYISKKMLRYADKRFSGEMRRADEGSTLHSMSKVEKNLRPNAAVNVSKNFGFKFKARVLQGKAIVDVKNPWVECNATVGVNGKAKLITRKEFKEVGMASGAEFSVNDSTFLTYIDQQVTDNVKARISNTSGVDADSRLEMMASFPFNL
ncbi:hypothetical protein SHI21_03205 [Bacteriovorax sp. PP10]|uniref:Uncharacterized protein n=1 Tax=Bacteriovorax antarcticus TaxID=3088717 RepID=A0ABU5VQ67_9BACT|nr:hypothetical protein [Bacteriovorax sp. PP10]MEA9355188.1 hypothetical protein [Bacteriovorax sp. PP10]